MWRGVLVLSICWPATHPCSRQISRYNGIRKLQAGVQRVMIMHRMKRAKTKIASTCSPSLLAFRSVLSSLNACATCLRACRRPGSQSRAAGACIFVIIVTAHSTIICAIELAGVNVAASAEPLQRSSACHRPFRISHDAMRQHMRYGVTYIKFRWRCFAASITIHACCCQFACAKATTTP